MRLFTKIGMALSGLAALFMVSGCNITAQSATDTTLAYACPIAIAIQASAVAMTVTEKTALATAVADCNIYTSQGIAGLTAPATVATVVVEAILAIQNGASFTALAPELQSRIIVGHKKLNLALKNARLSGFGSEAGGFVGHLN